MTPQIERFRASVALGAGSASFSFLYFLFYGSGASWMPFFNVYLAQLGFSGTQIGFLAGVIPAVMLVSQPVWGVVADIWGRRRTLLVTMLMASLLVLGFTLSRRYAFILVWTVFLALLSNPVGALVDSLVLHHVQARRGVSFGQLRMWGAIGWGTMAFVVGNIVTGRDLRLIFVVAAISMFLGWIIALRLRSEKQQAGSLRQSWSGLGQLLGNRRLVIFLLLVMFLETGGAAIFSFYPVYLDSIGASRRLLGIAIGLEGLSELPIYLAGATILRTIGARWTLVFSFTIYAARAFLYSVITTPEVAAAVELCHGLSFALFLVAAVDYVDRQVPTEWRATGQALLWTAYFGAGAILGNNWAGFLIDRIGIQPMFRVNGWILLGVAVAAAVVVREPSTADTTPTT